MFKLWMKFFLRFKDFYLLSIVIKLFLNDTNTCELLLSLKHFSSKQKEQNVYCRSFTCHVGYLLSLFHIPNNSTCIKYSNWPLKPPPIPILTGFIQKKGFNLSLFILYVVLYITKFLFFLQNLLYCSFSASANQIFN